MITNDDEKGTVNTPLFPSSTITNNTNRTSTSISQFVAEMLISGPFTSFVSTLQCSICHNELTTTLVTPCSHHFCSVCIRRALAFRSQCPLCAYQFPAAALRTNVAMDNVIRQWRVLMQTLTKQCYESAGNEASHSNMDNDERLAPPVINADLVVCPVCFLSIPLHRIEEHVATCTIGIDSIHPPSDPILASPPKEDKNLGQSIAYHLLSTSAIRSLLASVSLPTTGSRNELIARHRTYGIQLAIAQDAKTKVSLEDVRRKVLREEDDKKRAKNSKKPLNKSPLISLFTKQNDTSRHHSQSSSIFPFQPTTSTESFEFAMNFGLPDKQISVMENSEMLPSTDASNEIDLTSDTPASNAATCGSASLPSTTPSSREQEIRSMVVEMRAKLREQYNLRKKRKLDPSLTARNFHDTNLNAIDVMNVDQKDIKSKDCSFSSSSDSLSMAESNRISGDNHADTSGDVRTSQTSTSRPQSHWRAVWSVAHHCIFYWNSETKIGQFTPP